VSSLPDFESLTVGAAQRACVAPLKDDDIDEPGSEARLLVGSMPGGGTERVMEESEEDVGADKAMAENEV